MCNTLTLVFLRICQDLGIPIAAEKTEWGSPIITFLGFLLDGSRLSVPFRRKRELKAVNALNWVLGRKKATIKELQQLAGLLNCLNQAIFPGRAFTRRMYFKFHWGGSSTLKRLPSRQAR